MVTPLGFNLDFAMVNAVENRDSHYSATVLPLSSSALEYFHCQCNRSVVYF